MNTTFRSLLPALILAGGMLTSSALAVTLAPTAVNMLGSAFVLSLTALFAGALDSKNHSGVWRVPRSGWIIAASVLMSCGLVAFENPSQVAELLPVLGACFAPVVMSSPRCCLPLSRRAASSR